MSWVDFRTALLASIQRRLPIIVERAYVHQTGMTERYPTLPATQPDGVEHSSIMTTGAGGTYTEGAGYPAPDLGAAAFGTAPFGNYAGTFEISKKQISQAMAAGDFGVDRLASTQAELVEAKIVALQNVINADMINGTTAIQINGLASMAIQDAARTPPANVYQGIDRAVFPQFECMVFDNPAGAGVLRNVTSAVLTGAIATWKAAMGVQSLTGWEIYCDSTVRQAIKAIDITVHGNVAAPGVKYLGFSDISVEGLPVFAIPGWPANRIDFVNPAAPQRFSLEKLVNGSDWMMDVDTTAGSDVVTYAVVSHQQLKFRNPRHNAFSIRDIG